MFNMWDLGVFVSFIFITITTGYIENCNSKKQLFFLYGCQFILITFFCFSIFNSSPIKFNQEHNIEFILKTSNK